MVGVRTGFVVRESESNSERIRVELKQGAAGVPGIPEEVLAPYDSSPIGRSSILF